MPINLDALAKPTIPQGQPKPKAQGPINLDALAAQPTPAVATPQTSPPTDPEVQAIQEYERMQSGGMGPPLPQRSSVLPAPFQPGDVAAGGALGLRAGGGLLGALRGGAEFGAMAPTQAAAQPYIERAIPGQSLPARAGRFAAEQAVGLAPVVLGEAVSRRVGGRPAAEPPTEPPVAPEPPPNKPVVSPTTGKPLYRFDRETQTMKPVLEKDVRPDPVPPTDKPDGTIHTGGPAAPEDGRTAFDPNVPPTKPPERTYWDRLHSIWRHRVGRYFPQDDLIRRRIPESPVISATERFRTNLTDGLSQMLATETKVYRELPAEDWINAESRAVDMIRSGASEEEALKSMPQAIQDVIRTRQARFVDEQAARELLGLPEIHEYPFPYLARRTKPRGEEAVRVFRRGGYMQNLRTTLGSFQRERTFQTMREGMLEGTEYEDPRISALQREWLGLQLRETADFIKSIEGKTLFRTPEAARMASATGKAIPVEDFVPGGRRWWATSPEEATFIKHQFQEHQSALGSFVHYSNALFRNPNLVNPVPHFSKNMMAKFVLARGNPLRLPKDMYELFHRTNPEMVTRFEEVMSTPKTGHTPHEMLSDAIASMSPSKAVRAISKVRRVMLSPNALSSKALFQYGDPGMRYSLWKSYVKRGMSDQEAANNVWVDLIRYGNRSEVLDFWKSWPTNFFVPWRWGSFASLLKLSGNRPVRTALLLGAIDYAREARYRASGRWTHLPWDYVYGPVAEMVQHPKSAGYILPATAVFGPGGGFAASQLRDVFGALSGRNPNELSRMRNMFWGISQLYELPKEWEAYKKTGDTSHIINMFTSALLGEHEAMRYEPVRLSRGIPTSLPGMGYKHEVAASLPIPALSESVSREVRRVGLESRYETRVTVPGTGKSVEMPKEMADKFAVLRGEIATKAIEPVIQSQFYQHRDAATQKRILQKQFAKARKAALMRMAPDVGKLIKGEREKGQPTPDALP